MGWEALIPILLQNAPAAIDTAIKFFDWAKITIAGAADALNKPAELITAAELLAHIAQIKAQSGKIQNIP